MTKSRIVTIQGYAPTDIFATKLADEYDNFLCGHGNVPTLIPINSLYFESSAFPEQYTFDTLESDLQQAITVLKNADVITIITTFRKDYTNPKYNHFISRLFHLLNGGLNRSIWGDVDFHKKKLRNLTVFTHLDSDALVGREEMKKSLLLQSSAIAVQNFRLLGFEEVYSSMFRNFRESIHEKYALKYFRQVRELAEKDLYLNYKPEKNQLK
ncbi:hypothetical protein QEG73_22995 [Chitinophagaceae bacterium 26-R-25]|nr:hypothetical protein [Chitinophagaceae bacterium 26-R-25]